MWPDLPHLKQIFEFETGFELERFDLDDCEVAITSIKLEYNGGSLGAGRSRALELSRDSDCNDYLMEFDIACCLLRVLLERNDE